MGLFRGRQRHRYQQAEQRRRGSGLSNQSPGRSSSRNRNDHSNNNSNKTVSVSKSRSPTTSPTDSLDVVAVVHQTRSNMAVVERGSTNSEQQGRVMHPTALRGRSRKRPPKTSENQHNTNHQPKRDASRSPSFRSFRTPSFKAPSFKTPSFSLRSFMRLSRKRKSHRTISVIPAQECVSLDLSEEGFETQLGKEITYSGARGDFDDKPRYEMRPKDLPKNILTKQSVDMLVSQKQQQRQRYQELRRKGNKSNSNNNKTTYVQILPNVHIVPIDTMSAVTHDTYMKYGGDEPEVPKTVKETSLDDDVSAVTSSTWSHSNEHFGNENKPLRKMVPVATAIGNTCVESRRLLSTLCCIYDTSYNED